MRGPKNHISLQFNDIIVDDGVKDSTCARYVTPFGYGTGRRVSERHNGTITDLARGTHSLNL